MQRIKKQWLYGGCLGLVILLSGCGSTTVAPDDSLTCQPECDPLLVNRIRVGLNPIGVSVSPDGRWIYTANSTGNSVSKVDSATMQVVSTISMEGTPVWIAAAPQKPEIAVTARVGQTLQLIDTDGNYVKQSIDLPYAPERVVLHPTRPLAYIGSGSAPFLSVVDLDKGRVIQNVSTQSECQGLGITPDGSLLYVSTRAARYNVLIFSTADMSLITRTNAGSNPVAVAVNPNGEYAYFANHDSSDVTVLHIPTQHPVMNLPVGAGPVAMAVHPNGKFLFVSCKLDNSVAVVDLTSLAVNYRIQLDVSPWGVALNPDGSKLYVANYQNRITDTNTPNRFNASQTILTNASAGVNNNMLLVFDTQKYR